MSNDFFYEMNKKLQQVVDSSKSVHQKLNEGAVLAKLRGKNESVEEGMFDSLKKGMAKAGKVAKAVGKKGIETLGHGSDEDLRKDLQRKMGLPPTGKKPMGEEYGPMESEGGIPITPKQKKFAKLAPPTDKITFADKIAGAKKEVDEMLGDVAADAMRKAVKGKKVADEGSDWSQLGKEWSKPKVGSVERGAKHDIEHTATGRRVTRRTDDQGISVGADDEAGASPVKRGRGRPKGSGKSLGAKGPNGKSKLLSKPKEIEEKAVSKKQQKFMGMVHAAQQGEKPASKEVAKVAKTMKKKDAEDFAATKHKGLPEKKKSEGKKKEKTEEAGGTATPTASSGFSYGKGIYDSLNREIENLISESMSINMSDSTEGGKSLTVTATDDDALALASMLQNAGIGASQMGHEHSEQCPTCGSEDCGCGDVHEALDENQPDWPTDEVVSDDALQYAGGLNKPKTTVAGDGQTTVPVTAVQVKESEDQYKRELRKMLESAGIQEDTEDWTVDTTQQVPQTPQFSINRYLKDPTIAQYSDPLFGLLQNYSDDEAKLADLVKRYTLPSERDREFNRMKNLVNYYKERNAASMASYKARTDAEAAEKAKQQQQQQADTLAAAKKGISGMYEQEQVMAPESVEESKEMCDVCEATPCKCDESIEESLARFRSLAGIQEAAKPDFTDVDKDGDEKESWKKAEQDKKDAEDKKVEESIFCMTNLWKAYKG